MSLWNVQMDIEEGDYDAEAACDGFNQLKSTDHSYCFCQEGNYKLFMAAYHFIS